MNKRNFLIIFLAAVAISALSSCEKKYIIDVAQTCPTCAQVKFVNGDPDPASSFQFFINNQKVTGNALAFSGLFPGTVEYAAIPSGNVLVNVEVMNKDSTFNSVASGNVNLEAGKRYGLIWSGTAGKDPVIVIPNNDQPTDSGYIMANFVNLIKDNQTVDVLNSKGNIIFGAVPYMGVKDYVKLPASDTYTIQETGTNLHLYTAKLGLSQTRNYTWFATGLKYDTTSKSKTHIILDYYTNGYPKP
ncbi:MAG: DUF4397 domain-containing protein [Chitinophagaceae bacterium]|nr:MAG: DUF4397 domain-containing protein [Chitinophagaceae bacterium]